MPVTFLIKHDNLKFKYFLHNMTHISQVEVISCVFSFITRFCLQKEKKGGNMFQ